MKFLDKITLQTNLKRVCRPRNELLTRCSEGAQTRFLPVPFYLAAFYEGIGEDSNTKELLQALSRTSDERLDLFNKTLVFWWFWSGDRLMHLSACSLSNPEVQEGLRSAWGVSDDAQASLIKLFDESPQSNVVNLLWKCLCSKNILDNSSLDPLFVFPHLDNAQIGILRSLGVRA